MKTFYSYESDRLRPDQTYDLFQIERRITLNALNANDWVRLFAGIPKKELERIAKASVDAEKVIFAEATEAADRWMRQAMVTELAKTALRAVTVPEAVEHTENRWVSRRLEPGDDTVEEISNKAFKMTVRIYHYDKPEVTWSLVAQTCRHAQIAGQTQKKFKTLAEAEKYVAGRKKRYEGFFKEIDPEIEPEYKWCYQQNGILIPGYKIKGEDNTIEAQNADEVLKKLNAAVLAGEI